MAFASPLLSLLLFATIACQTTPAMSGSRRDLAQVSEPFTVDVSQTVFGGSGCPAGTVEVVPSPDSRTVSVLFDGYTAVTDAGDHRDRKTCNLAMPVRVPNGVSLGVAQVDYRGSAKVPSRIPGASAHIRAEYYWAGQRGPVRDTSFPVGFDDVFTLTDTVVGRSVVYSPCGEDVIFRINTSLRAQKASSSSNGGEVEITVDTSDINIRSNSRQLVPFFEAKFVVRQCSA